MTDPITTAELSAKLRDDDGEQSLDRAELCEVAADRLEAQEAALAERDATIARLRSALEWYGSLPAEWKIDAAGLVYGDLHILGEKARTALADTAPATGEETGR